MNTIIEKIRAEVTRLKKEGENGDALAQANNDYESHLQWEQQIAVANGLLSVLSDLEKECEKPTNIDFEQELYKHFGQVKDFTLGMQIGKYFYELGKQEKPTTAEGLEEEMDKFFETMPVLEHENIFEDTFKNIARHFAKWGAEHLKK